MSFRLRIDCSCFYHFLHYLYITIYYFDEFIIQIIIYLALYIHTRININNTINNRLFEQFIRSFMCDSLEVSVNYKTNKWFPLSIWLTIISSGSFNTWCELGRLSGHVIFIITNFKWFQKAVMLINLNFIDSLRQVYIHLFWF